MDALQQHSPASMGLFSAHFTSSTLLSEVKKVLPLFISFLRVSWPLQTILDLLIFDPSNWKAGTLEVFISSLSPLFNKCCN